jgi:hypothetical protein
MLLQSSAVCDVVSNSKEGFAVENCVTVENCVRLETVQVTAFVPTVSSD